MSKSTNDAQKAQSRRGAAAVEFAMVAPVLLLVIMSTLEFGRGMLVKQVVTNAARVGAREASLPNSTTDSVQSAADTYAASAGIDGVTVTTTPAPTTAVAGDQISVTVTIGFDEVSWLPAPWFLGGVNLESTAVMRKEGFE